MLSNVQKYNVVYEINLKVEYSFQCEGKRMNMDNGISQENGSTVPTTCSFMCVI